MTKQEFIDSLQEYYKPANDLVLSRLNYWLDDNYVDDYSKFFDVITENYKYKSFPGLPDFKDFIKILKASQFIREGGLGDRYIQAKKDQWKRVVNEDIMKVIYWLEKAKKNDSTLATNLLHNWDDILRECWECRRLKFSNEETRKHLEYVRDCIKQNLPFDRLGVELKDFPDVNLKKV